MKWVHIRFTYNLSKFQSLNKSGNCRRCYVSSSNSWNCSTFRHKMSSNLTIWYKIGQHWAATVCSYTADIKFDISCTSVFCALDSCYNQDNCHVVTYFLILQRGNMIPHVCRGWAVYWDTDHLTSCFSDTEQYIGYTGLLYSQYSVSYWVLCLTVFLNNSKQK